MAEYYSMQEVMDKLRKTEEEVQELVKQGQLRQYLDDGNPVFKIDDVDNLAEEIVGLDITSLGDSMGEVLDLDLDLEKTSESEAPKEEQAEVSEAEPVEISEVEPEEVPEVSLEETADIELLPDEGESDEVAPKAGPDDMELDIKPDVNPESEGGFGLSQMGDLTMADTNVGTIGINILSGTGDAYQLTEDTRAETKVDDVDEIGDLDADANLESLGSGSGLLDLSLQADDTSLGAVLDDILPTGAEGGPIEPAGGIDEAADLLAEPEPVMAASEPQAAVPSAAEPMARPVGAVQTIAIAQVDPKTNIFGVMMFLPVLGLVLLAIVLVAGAQKVLPSMVKTILEIQPAGVNLIWYIVGGASVLSLLIVAFSAVGGGSGGGGGGKTRTKTKKAKEKKPKKEKKAKKRK